MSEQETVHVPVLLHEILEGLLGHESVSKPYWYLDGTLGGAGHAHAMAVRYEKSQHEKLNIVAFDRDSSAISRAQEKLASVTSRCVLINDSYRNLDTTLDAEGITSIDGALFDLGISSDELDVSGKGFSFMRDEPLYMTMGKPESYPFTARDIVNSWAEEDIANVIFGYGEDRYARRIARAVVAYRTKKEIQTTTELAEIVQHAVPKQFRTFGKKPIHPATKTFQALRIAVNDELGALKEGLTKIFDRMSPGGRVAVISFHSLEDRIVKEFFRAQHIAGKGKLITKKPITAGPQEVAENPRSRSAKLRIIQKN